MKIKKNNLLSFDKFIEESLYNKKFGYYMKNNPFGEKGDFITAPNISVLFSEMIAIWVVSFWENLNCPKKFNENSRLFRGILYLIDAKDDTETIEFTAPKRFSGHSKYNFFSLFNLAIDSIIAFSIKPLRIALLLSSIIFLLSLTYGLYTLINWSIGNILVPGLTTIYLLTIILGSGNLLVLSVIGDYIGRIHIESKNRPLYTVRESINFDD